MMASVITRINALVVEVQNTQGGCTTFCQDVDVGVAKPTKDIFKDQLEVMYYRKRNKQRINKKYMKQKTHQEETLLIMEQKNRQKQIKLLCGK